VRVGGDDVGEVAFDLERRLDAHSGALGHIHVERRCPHPDVVARRGGDRPVDAEDLD
jgi:hypothetical protein